MRMFTGDELSKRAKFAFITWIGPAVSALKRARVSIDKSLVKEVVSVLLLITNTIISYKLNLDLLFILKEFCSGNSSIGFIGPR